MVLIRVTVVAVLAAAVSLQANAEVCLEPTIVHGSVSGGGAGESYFGRVTCDPGYQLVGGSRLKCRGGRWSPMEPPVCAAPAACSSTPELPRGRAVPVRGSRGAAMRFKCRHGYKLYGPRTTHCTGDSWSHAATPACVRATCEEEGRMSIPYGEARALLGGGVYKYRCNAGLAMAGSDTVFCNGDSWNSSVPTCLVAPGQPHLTLPNMVQVGEEVEVSCQATDGNPLPTVALSLQGKILGEGALSVSVPLSLTHSHHGQQVVCEASSSAGSSRLHQTLHVLSKAPSYYTGHLKPLIPTYKTQTSSSTIYSISADRKPIYFYHLLLHLLLLLLHHQTWKKRKKFRERQLSNLKCPQKNT